MKILAFIKAQAGKLRENALEIYAYLFVCVGLSAIAYIYFDWRASVATFVVINAIIGILAIIQSVRQGTNQ